MNQLVLTKDEKYHLGMEECWSLAKIAAAMQYDGWKPGAIDLSAVEFKTPKLRMGKPCK